MLRTSTDEIIAIFYLLTHVEPVLLLCILAFLFRLDIHDYIPTFLSVLHENLLYLPSITNNKIPKRFSLT